MVGDLTDDVLIGEWAKKTDGTIHTAAIYSEQYVPTDTKVSHAVIAALAGTGKKFVYTSGVWGYGDHGQEDITEATPEVKAKSFPFGQNHRVELEQDLLEKAKAANVHLIIPQPVSVIAKDVGTYKVYAKLAAEGAYLGDGEQYHPLIHAKDIGPFYLAAYEKAPAGSTYLAYTATHKFKDNIKHFGLTGAPTKHLTLDEATKEFSVFGYALFHSQKVATTKAFTELGFKPQYTTIDELFGVEA